MPIYEYQCESCGLRKEKLWKSLSVASEGIECECGKNMKKRVTAANFKFSHPPSQTRGVAPPSTGTSDDWKFDLAIGRDSEKKWRDVEKREKVKDSHIKDERKAGRAVTRDHLVPKSDGSGEYRTITESERVKVNENRETAFAISKATQKKKAAE